MSAFRGQYVRNQRIHRIDNADNLCCLLMWNPEYFYHQRKRTLPGHGLTEKSVFRETGGKITVFG